MPDFLLMDMLVRMDEALETKFLPSIIMRDGRVEARRGWMGELGRSSYTTRRIGETRCGWVWHICISRLMSGGGSSYM